MKQKVCQGLNAPHFLADRSKGPAQQHNKNHHHGCRVSRSFAECVHPLHHLAVADQQAADCCYKCHRCDGKAVSALRKAGGNIVDNTRHHNARENEEWIEGPSAHGLFQHFFVCFHTNSLLCVCCLNYIPYSRYTCKLSFLINIGKEFCAFSLQKNLELAVVLLLLITVKYTVQKTSGVNIPFCLERQPAYLLPKFKNRLQPVGHPAEIHAQIIPLRQKNHLLLCDFLCFFYFRHKNRLPAPVSGVPCEILSRQTIEPKP